MPEELAQRLAAAIRAPWKALERKPGWPIDRWQAEAVLLCLKRWVPEEVRVVLPAPPERLVVGDLALRVDSGEVKCAGAWVRLPPRHAELLALFMRNAGVVLSRKQIMDAMSSSDGIGEKSIHSYIHGLRVKVPGYITTVRGFGYTLAVGPGAS